MSTMGQKQRATHKLKPLLFRQQRGKCFYCRRNLEIAVATLDHITPKALGGKTTWHNLAIACTACQRAKQAHSLDEYRSLVFGVKSKRRFWGELNLRAITKSRQKTEGGDSDVLY